MQNKQPTYSAGKANARHRNANLPTGDTSYGADNWYQSAAIQQHAITFKNVYAMPITANVFVAKAQEGQVLPAIIVAAPHGAVKEQAANLYAIKMAERGFVTVTFDQPFWGASTGILRQGIAPVLFSESFSAAADYLTTLDCVDNHRIGVIAIGGAGGFAIDELKVDTRLKALATINLVDLGAVARTQRDSLGMSKMITASAAFRTLEAAGEETHYAPGVPAEIGPDTDEFAQECYDFYRTQRGAANTTTQPTLTTFTKLLNFHPLIDIQTISPRPLLFIAGEKAPTRTFSETAYAKASEPKTLLNIAGASHVDLYDKTTLIPFDSLNTFFTEHLQ